MQVNCILDQKILKKYGVHHKVMAKVNATDTICTIKVMVSLVISNLDPDSFDIHYNARKLNDNEIVHQTGMRSGDSVDIKYKGYHKCCLIY